MVELGDWIESNKYSKATIGSIGGGILANEIAANFQQTVTLKRKAKVRLRSRGLFERKGPTIWFYKSFFSRLLAVILNWSKNARWQKDSYNFPDNVFKSIFLSIFQNLKPDEPVFIRYLSVTKWFMRQFMVGFAAGLYVGYCRCWRRRFSRAVQRTIMLIGLNMWSDFATALICGNRCWTLREGAERVKWNLKVGHI